VSGSIKKFFTNKRKCADINAADMTPASATGSAARPLQTNREGFGHRYVEVRMRTEVTSRKIHQQILPIHP
jgi:hypothetical protein